MQFRAGSYLQQGRWEVVVSEGRREPEILQAERTTT